MTLALTTLKSLDAALAPWRKAGDAIALVPTMGALHAGHMMLVEEAKKHAPRVVVSIFVNPTQFGPNEDFNRYPRPLEKDLELLRTAGVDAAWLPTVAEMYPEGSTTTLRAGDVAQGLDGAFRPGHFDGVATVVSKLLRQVAPSIALFGEKDYQQLCVIKRMVADEDVATTILGVPTVREADGLALSSRNQYLSASERAVAPVLHKAMVELAVQLKQMQTVAPAQAEAYAAPQGDPRLRGDDSLGALIERAKKQITDAGFSNIDYLALCDAATLAPLTQYQPGARLLVAARLGTTRLIDNIEVE